MDAGTEPTLRLSFGRDPAAPRRARHACATRLHAFPPWVVQDVLVIVSELVTNVVAHTPSGEGTVQLVVRPGHVWVGVSDGDPRPVDLDVDPPEPGPPPGLFLVRTLAGQVGVVRDGQGKTVWAAVAT